MKSKINWRLLTIMIVVVALAFVAPMALAAKGGNQKGQGPGAVKKKGPFSSISGQVTNNLSGAGLAGVTVAIGPYSAVTGADGVYSENKLPVGCYDISAGPVTVGDIDYQAASTSVCANKSFPAVADMALDPDPNEPVIVELSVDGDAVPGATLAATVSINIQDGSTLLGTDWSSEGLATLTPDTTTAEVALGDEAGFKAGLIEILESPPIGEDELPPNVPPPPDGFVGGLQDRFQVVGINHWALERAGHVAVEVCVETTSGEYCDHADVHTHLAYAVNPGLRNVPVDATVLLHGKDQGGYEWTLAAPLGSAAMLKDANTQNPEFTPDVSGEYGLTEANSGVALEVYGGMFDGIIVGQDLDGRPVADPACTGCHSPGSNIDKFTPWAQTGHAEIFTNNLNNSTHYGPNCFDCHTVGFNPDAADGGSDDAADYEEFLQAGLLNNPGDNWTEMVGVPGTVGTGAFPETARLANIQCENCHGPQALSGAHTGDFVAMDPRSRTSLSSDVCASCHGEPARHARFQQWQLSRHSNYELAIDESQSGNCSRCHTSNGFLAWLPVLLDDDPLTDPTASLPDTPWTEDETHPQTCVTCHDPHAIGTTSGINTDANIRISDNTPLLTAGFQALGVGRGAMCMTCHNSRRGLRNDDVWAGLTDQDRSPHGGVQTDLLMGQNAYFIDTAQLGTTLRGNHSYIEDSCVNCHMEQTLPPDDLSYNQGGTNHTFFASVDICSRCHGEGFTAAGVQAGIIAQLEVLDGLIEAEYIAVIADLIAAGNIIDVDGDATIVDAADVLGISMSHTRGRQALVFELNGVGTVGPARLTTIDVIGPDAPSTLFDHAGDDLLKAGWNRNLVEEDASHGIHNPSYSTLVLTVAINALQ